MDLGGKSPSQELLNTKHVEQAYSYAIHSEIKALYYALCNGKEFILYHVSDYKPILHFDIKLLPYYWNDLMNLLSPERLFHNSNRDLNKDFGLHLKRLGFDVFKGLFFLEVPVPSISKLNDDLYTFGTNIIQDEDRYCVSFDFNHEVFWQLRGKIPKKAFEILEKPLDNAMVDFRFADALFYVNIQCEVSNKLQENDKEIFLPLVVERFI